MGLRRRRPPPVRAWRDDPDSKIPFGGVVIGLAIMLPIYAAIALVLALLD